MKTLFSLPLIFLFILSPRMQACTTFGLFRGEDRIVGKSFQWFNDSGWAIVNPRNLAKQSVEGNFGDKSVPWISKYGSLTFNQHGREFPLSGVNERGLVVEIMVGGRVDMSVDDRPSVNELQWVQYQLDNYATVKEMVNDVRKLRISRISGLVHYLACDPSGDCAAFEPFYGNDWRVYHGDTLPVRALANDSYASSLMFLKKHIGFGGAQPIPDGPGSLERFVRAATLVHRYPDAPNELGSGYAFEVLRNLAWSAQWEMVYDLKNHFVHFRTVRFPAIKKISINDWEYSCLKPVPMLDLNQDMGEQASPFFLHYSEILNEKIVDEGVKGLSLPDEIIGKLKVYPLGIKCMETGR